MSERERRHALLQEANEQLVLAALTAQELQAAAERAQQRQTGFVVTLGMSSATRWCRSVPRRRCLGGISMNEPLLPRMQAIIERQVAHKSRLVDDLLDTTRVSTGKHRLERREAGFVSVMDAAVDARRPGWMRACRT
jgi:signal transduction histidine kinase